MERGLALAFPFVAPFFATFVLRQQHWAQELVANVWWAGLIVSFYSLWLSVRVLVSRRRLFIGGGGIIFSLLTLIGIVQPLAKYSPFYEEAFVADGTSFSFLIANDGRLSDGRLIGAAADLVVLPSLVKAQSARFMIESLGVDSMGEAAAPLASFRIHVPDCAPIDLYVVSFSGDVNQSKYVRRRITLRRLSTLLRHRKEPAIIAGDFGSGPFGRVYAGFVNAARVEDPRWGRWPASIRWSKSPPQISFLGAFTKLPAVITNLDTIEQGRALRGTVTLSSCAPRS